MNEERRKNDMENKNISAQLVEIKGHLMSITSDVSITSKRVEELSDKVDFLTQYEMHPKTHYDVHQELEQFLKMYRMATSLLFKALLGLGILGAAFLIGLGSIAKWLK